MDRNDVPYVFHPFHLAEQMDSQETVIIALLHDVIEDTNLTIEDLKNEGFPEICIEAIELLTHTDEKDYFEYVHEIKKSNNPYAKVVKLADLIHNCDNTRLSVVEKKIWKDLKNTRRQLRF